MTQSRRALRLRAEVPAQVPHTAMIMAAGLLVTAPVAAVFVFIQKFLLAGWGSG